MECNCQAKQYEVYCYVRWQGRGRGPQSGPRCGLWVRAHVQVPRAELYHIICHAKCGELYTTPSTHDITVAKVRLPPHGGLPARCPGFGGCRRTRDGTPAPGVVRRATGRLPGDSGAGGRGLSLGRSGRGAKRALRAAQAQPSGSLPMLKNSSCVLANCLS